MDWTYESNKELLITYTDDDGNTVTIGNESTVPETFSLSETLCSSEQMEFGCCEASEFNITISNDFGRLIGKQITVQVRNDSSDTSPYTLGTYYVESDKAVSQRTQRTIVAYDRMYWLAQTDVSSWYNSFWGTATSATLSALATALGNYLGITIPVSSTFSSLKVYKSLDTAVSLMATDILSAIGALTAGSYHIGRDGSMEFIEFGTTSTTYTLDDMMDGDAEEFTTDTISKVVLQEANGTAQYSYGSGDVVYTITGNILMTEDGLSEQGTTYATYLYAKLSTLAYSPVDIEVVADPRVKVGQTIVVPFRDGSTATSYVFQRILKGVQGMTDSITAYGEETRSIDNSIQALLNNATNTANAANSNATTALDKADSASQTATTAKNTADTAKQAADDAQDTAETAQGTADGIATNIYSDGTNTINGQRITENTITATQIDTSTLIVGDNIAMGDNATISWSNVTSQPTIPSKTSQLTNDSSYTTMTAVENKGYQTNANVKSTVEGYGYQTASQVTQITKDTITTSYVNALNITAKYLSVVDSSNRSVFSADAVSKSVTAGPFTVDYNSIYYGTAASGGSPKVFMNEGSDSTWTICGQSKSGWAFGANGKFGVLASGDVYADDLYIKTVINSATRYEMPICGIKIGTSYIEADQSSKVCDLTDYIGGSYTLPIANSSTLGGIKVGSNLSINSSTGVLSATNTWQANTVSQNGYVTAPTSSHANQVWRTDSSGKPYWGASPAAGSMKSKSIDFASTAGGGSSLYYGGRTYSCSLSAMGDPVMAVAWGIGAESSDPYQAFVIPMARVSSIATESSPFKVLNLSKSGSNLMTFSISCWTDEDDSDIFYIKMNYVTSGFTSVAHIRYIEFYY